MSATTGARGTASSLGDDEPAASLPRPRITYSRKRNREGNDKLKRSPNSGRIRPKFSSIPRRRGLTMSDGNSSCGDTGSASSALDSSPDPVSPPAEVDGSSSGAAGRVGAAAAAARETPVPALKLTTSKPVTFETFFGPKKTSKNSPAPQPPPRAAGSPEIVEAIAVEDEEEAAMEAAMVAATEAAEQMQRPEPTGGKKPRAKAKVFSIFRPGATSGDVTAPVKGAAAGAKGGSTAAGGAKRAAAAGKSKQLLLDVGQKGLGPSTCAVCGMMYTRSSEEDQVAHNDYHRKFELGVRFNGWKQERILRLFDQSEHGKRVIEVRVSDRCSHLQKFGQLKDVMDAEMGFVASTQSSGSGSGSPGSNSPLREGAGELAYILISATGTAVACAIVQRISVGFAVASHADATAAGDTSPGMHAPEASDSLVCSNSPQPCSVGIKQMWVHRSHRRKHHMTTLLDVIRANYTPGRTVPTQELAFTQTTPDGKQFAISYCETKHYKIYEANW